jgi:hypothetical protein
MVDPEVRDWERLRKEIPAIESKSIDNAMVACHTFVNQPYITDTAENLNAEEDVVNNPSHYNTGNIECIEAIEESMSSVAFKGYLKGNCMKYLWRYDLKGKQVEDLEKAGWYLRRLTAMVTEENS